MITSPGRAAYRAGVAVAVAASMMTVWVTIVREDDPYTDASMAVLLLVLAAWVGAFSAWFRPAGMARAMLGAAVMQVLLILAIATAPSAANAPDSLSRIYLFSAVFTALWLISAAFFRSAAQRESRASATA